VKQVNGVYVFEIKGNPAETWVLDLKTGNGSISRGAPAPEPKGAFHFMQPHFGIVIASS